MPPINKKPSPRGGRSAKDEYIKPSSKTTARPKINSSSSKMRENTKAVGRNGLNNTTEYGTTSTKGSSVGRPVASRGAKRTYTIKQDGIVGPQTGSALLGYRWNKMSGGTTKFTTMGARRGTVYTGVGKNPGAPQGYVNTGGKAFKQGMSGPQVVAIKKALASKGYFKGDVKSDKYDASTRSAVAKFQKDWNTRMSKPGHQTVRAARGQVIRLGD